MAALPKTLTFTAGGLNFRVIHGGVDIINRFVFASQRDVLAEETMRTDADVVIGMPANDGTPDVWYGLVRSEGDRIALSTHRLAYDHHGAAAAMRRCGHANGYARTLVTGLWPSLDVFPPAERAAAGQKLRPRTM